MDYYYYYHYYFRDFFHGLFKFSMTLGLVVTFKNFHNFPSLGVFFDLKQINRHKTLVSTKMGAIGTV